MLPLSGQRVLVTRPREQAAELVQGLEALGAEVRVVPVIAIAPPEDWGDLDRAIAGLGAFDWVALTSPNAVTALFGRIRELGVEVPSTLRWAVVGGRTGEGLRAQGFVPELVADPATSEALAERFVSRGVEGCRVLFPRGERARATLPERLEAAGAHVEAPVAYRTLGASDPGTSQALRAAMADLDWIIFTSPSTWQELAQVLGDTELPSGVKLAAIGPTTAGAIADSGRAVACIADPPGVQGLLSCLALMTR